MDWAIYNKVYNKRFIAGARKSGARLGRVARKAAEAARKAAARQPVKLAA